MADKPTVQRFLGTLSHQYFSYLLLACLLTCSAVTLWPGVTGPFLFDDENNIPKSFINEFTLDELAAATWANTSGQLKRPVAALSFALSQYTTGTEADGFKIHNIFLHLGIGLALFLLARRIFAALEFTATQQQWAALLTCAFWLLHPLHISTVLYPVQRMAQLSALFSIMAIYSYVRARQNRAQSHWLFWALPASMVLAVFSKENGALIPVYLLLIEGLLFGFKNHQKSITLRISWWLYIFVPLLIGLAYLMTHPGYFNYSNRSFTLTERIYTQCWVVADYLKMITLPNIIEMSIFHDDLVILNRWQQAAPFAALHLLLIGAALFSVKKLPLITLGIGWFYAGHLMESTLIPLEMMFEHRNYLALIGIAFIFGGTISKLSHRHSIKALAIILLIHLALSSFERASNWSNSTALYQSNAANHPQSARAHVSYANQLLIKGEFDLAAQLLLRAASLNSSDAGPLLHLIKVGCFGPIRFSENFHPHLQQHYKQTPQTAYGRQALHQISKLYMDGKCDRLNRTEFINTLNAIEGLKPHRRAELLLIKARLHSRSNLAKSRINYTESYQLKPDPRTLSEHAAILIKHHDIAGAMTVVEQLISKKNALSTTRLREFDALFNWYKKQQTAAVKAGDTP